MTNKSPIITILIPTRNRAKNLDNTLKRIVRSVEYAKASDGQIEVVVANNFSIDNTEKVSKIWSDKYPYIKYYKHQEPYPSAEESLFNGIKYCNGEYVWSFGDDDFIHLNAVSTIIKTLSKTNSEFILLNCEILTPDNKTVFKYMRSNYDLLEYDDGNKFFKDYGFISVTTTLSCLVFKKDVINLQFFRELSSLSRIYSHSFTIFLSFYKRKCAFLSVPLLTYKSNKIEDEFRSISNSSKDKSIFEMFSFSSGVKKLINYSSSVTNIPVEDILRSREIEVSRSAWCSVHGILLFWLIRSYISQLHLIRKKSFYHKVRNADDIKKLIAELLELVCYLDEHSPISKYKDWLREFFTKNWTLYYFLFRGSKRKLDELLIINNKIEYNFNLKIKDYSDLGPTLITKSSIVFRKMNCDTFVNILDTEERSNIKYRHACSMFEIS
ncbi:MAG: glycosyltransferase involved in cell wall biosynthesis [Rickettsiales bacterium]|jgi:glycosyltransferase involved in cell wall biosynthesis